MRTLPLVHRLSNENVQLKPISQIYARLPDQALPAQQVTEYVRFAQNESFFHLAVAKDQRIAELKAHFSKSGLRKVYLSANLGGFDCSVDGVEVEMLERDFFHELDPVRRNAKRAQLDGCIVIINNNDAGSPEGRAGYAEFFEEGDKTFFVAWDWDNHHWLDLSTFLAAYSDVYAPAHHENLYLLSRHNWRIAGPIYCSSVQWSRKFLTDHLHELLVAERSDAPLGMHIPYAQFSFRIQMISTLNKHFPTIGFSDRSFHVRTPEDRLKEWSSHKTHWIAPVLNDVPIRIFDALATGGIPIVPESLRLLPPINVIPRDYIQFYSAIDIVEPSQLVVRSNDLFDRSGRDGMVARHRFALDHHHGDSSVRKMVGYAAETLGIQLPICDQSLKVTSP